MSGVATALSGLAKRGLALVYPEVCQLCHDESAQSATATSVRIVSRR